MPNYIPKEKKPVLNTETIKNDLKQTNKPVFSIFLGAGFIVLMVMSIVFFSMIGRHGNDSVGLTVTCSILGGVFLATSIFFAFLIYVDISTYIKIKKGKFYIITDTINHKVAREKVRDWGNRREYNGDKYRYPNVLYFNKHGRYELCFDSEGYYGENEGRRQNRLARQLDSYSLEKEYIVVSFGKKKPKIALIYDPDEYDVQL